MKRDASPEVINDINFLRYREKFHLSYQEMAEEPVVEVERVLLIWSLEEERRANRANVEVEQ